MKNRLPYTVYRKLTYQGKQLLSQIFQGEFKHKFTEFEKNLLLLILIGRSKYEVAEVLNMSVQIVNFHASNIFNKLEDDSPESGSGVPRQPYPSSDDGFAAEAIPEANIPVEDRETMTLVNKPDTLKAST